ncbi:MAG: hypothetical protein QXW65_02240 [Candidatus Pacearchaeota archaeon]
MENEEKVILFVYDTEGEKEKAIIEALECNGYTIKTTKNYSLALQEIRKMKKKKLIILVKDLFSGLSSSIFLESIKRDESNKMPVIFLYRHSNSSSFEKNIEASFPYFSFNIKDLIDKIEELWKEKYLKS